MIKYIIYYFLKVSTVIPCPYAGNPEIKCSVKEHVKVVNLQKKTDPLPIDSVAIWIKANPKAEVRSIQKESN